MSQKDLPPPFVPIQGIYNLRDAGGYPIGQGSGNTVRKGLLFRSADPSKVDSQGQFILASLNVKTIFDLRSKPEIDRDGGPRDIDGFERIWVPIFEEKDYSPERLAMRHRQYAAEGTEGFKQAYADILSHAGPAFRRILQHIANNAAPESAAKPSACLVHCTAGKDRTGLLVALVLSLLGVEDGIVADEYALTDIGLAEWKPRFIGALMQHPSFQGEAGREGAARMVGSRKENMLHTLAMIREKYGSVEGYLGTVCELSSADISRIREAMTAKEERQQ